MKLKCILCLGSMAVAISAHAQTYDWRPDTLATGMSYSQDAYFNLDAGQVGSAPNNNWDLAFPGAPVDMFRHTVITNNYGNGLSGQLFDLEVSSAAFGTNLTADTAGKTPLTNVPETWEEGAFGVAEDMGGINPSSWGVYDPDTHYINGDKVYAYINNNGAYQIWLEQFKASASPANRKWIFHVANLDGTDTATIVFEPVIEYANKHLAYFNLQTREFINRDPDFGTWHLLATKYGDRSYSSSNILSTTGILTAPTVVVAVAQDVLPNDADEADYADAYSGNRNEIGGKYKALNSSTFEWEVKDSLSYFIKSVYGEDTGDIWQVYFDFFPVATSDVDVKIGARVRKVLDYIPNEDTTSIQNINQLVGNIVLAPNPSNGSTTNLLIDAKKDLKNMQIVVSDLSGRALQSATKNINAGFHQLRLDVSGYAPGLYMITLRGEGWTTTQKLIISR
jgi:hypothetical protein